MDIFIIEDIKGIKLLSLREIDTVLKPALNVDFNKQTVKVVLKSGLVKEYIFQNANEATSTYNSIKTRLAVVFPQS